MNLSVFMLLVFFHFLTTASAVETSTESEEENKTEESEEQDKEADEICWKNLGCFSMKSPWKSPLRPIPPPMSPDEVNVHCIWYSRDDNSGHEVKLWPEISDMSDFFNPNLPNAFIIHGFISGTKTSPWMEELKDAYLKHVDANVFLVDWSKGANHWNYLQAASNTRLVGWELARFMNYSKMEPSKTHLMGHSLGSHVAGYTAKQVKEEMNKKMGHITAFDCAQPLFEDFPNEVRLHKDDATFVEAIHTSARQFIPTLGFGMMESIGHIDYYMNGGMYQPGCALPDVSKLAEVKSLEDLGKIPIEVLGEWVGCSHGRSYEYYIAALSTNCTFIGCKTSVPLPSPLRALKPVTSAMRSFRRDTCIPLQLEAQKYEARGSFDVPTGSEWPFCEKDNERNKKALNDIFGIIPNKTKTLVNEVKKSVPVPVPNVPSGFLG